MLLVFNLIMYGLINYGWLQLLETKPQSANVIKYYMPLVGLFIYGQI
jgi:hypothetical protein